MIACSARLVLREYRPLHRLLAAAQAEFLQARPVVPNGRPARMPYHTSRAR